MPTAKAYKLWRVEAPDVRGVLRVIGNFHHSPGKGAINFVRSKWTSNEDERIRLAQTAYSFDDRKPVEDDMRATLVAPAQIPVSKRELLLPPAPEPTWEQTLLFPLTTLNPSL